MQITIADRFKPFSHLPGTTCVLPRTALRFQIFPELIRVNDTEIRTGFSGPVKDFTVQLDLEKGRIRVWGQTINGYMRYSIYPAETLEGYALIMEKEEALPQTSVLPLERLSLGSNKQLDWEMVKRRMDMTEILPVWFFLGQQLPKQPRAPSEGTAAFLHQCRRVITLDDSRHFLQPFKNLFQAGFDGILSPRKTDTDFQGFHLPGVESEFSEISLLTEGAELIRSLFFSYNDRVVDILPALPVEFHCGRFLNLSCGNQGTLDLEWTKKKPRRVIFHAKETGMIRFALPSDIKQFRLRTSEADRGRKIDPKTVIEISAGTRYCLDRFQV